MSIIDKALKANQSYPDKYDRKLGAHPVTCMDPRLSDLPEILGCRNPIIDVIRTGGPAVTQDVLAELIVSNRVLGTTEITRAPIRFFSYKDLEENTRGQILEQERAA
jgi:carbonic anhydrase